MKKNSGSILTYLDKIIHKINYKYKKDTLDFIINLNNTLKDKEEDIIKTILENLYNEIRLKIENNEFNEKQLNAISKLTQNYYKKNKTQYLDKIKCDSCIIYEYIDEYKIYTKSNDIDNIKSLIKEKFPDSNIKKIILDNVEWNSITNIQNIDLKNIKKVIITIEKESTSL